MRISFSKIHGPALLSTLLCLSGFCVAAVQAATLPAHEPISILIIADEVNPHQLSDAGLTQPQDLAPALNAADSPLAIASINTVDSQCIDNAINALDANQVPDVVLYFAHRAAKYCDGTEAETRLTQLLEKGLKNGLGVVMLHHGWYVDFRLPGAKDELLALLGARTNSIEWNTESGQRVYNVGGTHFVSSNGISYSKEGSFVGVNAVPAGTYPYFDNIPDELYSDTILVEEAGEVRTPLFATDSSGERLLGYVLQRQGWTGKVVAYQPAEYQPNALDDRDGPNYQILLNSLYFAVYGE